MKIEKLFLMESEEITKHKAQDVPDGISLDKVLELLEYSNLTGMSGNGF